MNRLLLVAALLLPFALPAPAQLNVNFPYKTADNTTPGVRTITLFYLPAPAVNSNAIVIVDPVRKATGIAGSVTISNLVPGTWRGEFSYPNRPTTTNWWTWPATNGTISAADTNFLSVPTNYAGIVAYSTAASDARYLQAASIANMVTNQQQLVTLGLTNSTLTGGTNSYAIAYQGFSSVSNFFVSAVPGTNIGGLYGWQHTEVGGLGSDIYFCTNGTYGMIADLQQDDYPHPILITNGAGTVIAFSAGPLFHSSVTLFTNGVASSASVSISTNTLPVGNLFVGPIYGDGGGISNVVGTATNVSGHPPFDGQMITNTPVPANSLSALAQVPQFGWNSYCQSSCSVNENEVMAVMAEWYRDGTLAAGSCWIWIDCGWATTLTNVNSNFPNGITNIVNVAKGYNTNGNRFYVGIYASANGLPFAPSLTVQTAQTWMDTIAGWGINGLKLDGQMFDPANITEGHLYAARLLARCALNTRSNIVVDLTLHPPTTSYDGPAYLSPEIFDSVPLWEVTGWQEESTVNLCLGVADTMRKILWANQRGRCGQFQFAAQAGETEKQSTNRLSMDLVWPSFVSVGKTNLVTYWTNTELRAILSDGFVAPHQEVYSNSFTRIWARPLGGYWPAQKYAVLFINGMTNASSTTSNLTLTGQMLGWTNGTPFVYRDPYAQTDRGQATGSLTVSVATNDTAFYVVSAAWPSSSGSPPTFNANQFSSGPLGTNLATGLVVTNVTAYSSNNLALNVRGGFQITNNSSSIIGTNATLTLGSNSTAGVVINGTSSNITSGSFTTTAGASGLNANGTVFAVNASFSGGQGGYDQNSLGFYGHILDGNAGTVSIDPATRTLTDNSSVPVVDWGSREILYPDGTTVLLNLSSGVLNDNGGNAMIDLLAKNWATERIYYFNGSTYLLSIDVQNRLLANSSGAAVADWSGSPFKFMVPVTVSNATVLVTNGAIIMSNGVSVARIDTSGNFTNTGNAYHGGNVSAAGTYSGNGAGLTNLWVCETRPWGSIAISFSTAQNYLFPYGQCTPTVASTTYCVKAPTSGYISNLTARILLPFAATTNCTITVMTNIIYSAGVAAMSMVMDGGNTLAYLQETNSGTASWVCPNTSTNYFVIGVKWNNAQASTVVSGTYEYWHLLQKNQ